MAGNPWDNDAVVTPAPAPAPLPVSDKQGIIERPGQPTPSYVNVQSAQNAWDADKVVTPAPGTPETAGRVAGLTARGLAAAGGDLFDTLGNAIAATQHAGAFIGDTLRHIVGLGSGGPNVPFGFTHGRQTAENMATAVGAPQPASSGERLYTGAVEAAPMAVAGGAGALGAAKAAAPVIGPVATALGKYGMGAYGTYKLLHEVASGNFTAENAKKILETLTPSE